MADQRHIQDESNRGGQRNFATTRWSVVISAGKSSSIESRQALEKLCSIYWMPLYSFVRRREHDASRSADLTQGFFTLLLEREDLARIDQAKGRFRSFLLASLKNYLTNVAAGEQAIKRGGGQTVLSFDFQQADENYRLEPVENETPESIFDRQWALAILEQVRQNLRKDYEDKKAAKLFERLQGFLSGSPREDNYESAAEDLELQAANVRVTVHRMRKRFGELLREEIAQTVVSDDDVDAEIQELFAVLGGK